MRRCLAFSAAALTMLTLSARAEYLFVRIDLGQVYQNMPAMGQPSVPKDKPAPGNPPVPVQGPFVYAAIEARSKIKFEGKKDESGFEAGDFLMDHPWGKEGRFIHLPSLSPAIIKYTRIPRESPGKEFERQFKKELASSKDPKAFLNAARFAFQRGLWKEFHAAMDDAGRLDPKDPTVVRYRRVQSALKSSPAIDDGQIKQLIEDLAENDGKYRLVVEPGFYVALTNTPTGNDAGVRRKLVKLNETLERFYYWFAMGDDLPQPELPRRRLVLVVAGTADEFYARHDQFGSPAFTGDGVTPRRDNVILTSWRPLDEAAKFFEQNNQDLFRKLQIPKDNFVSGLIAKKGNIDFTGKDLAQIIFAQTLAIVQKAWEEEYEFATLSREGARQLLFASGILPRNVHIPEWIAHGLASYFESPIGAPYRSIGMPSWTHLVAFNDFRATRKLDPPEEVLDNLINDRYFRHAQRLADEMSDSGEKEVLARAMRDQMAIAEATAWSFVYYMIERRRQPNLLFRYCQELRSLPRDLDLGAPALEACFARAFDLGQKDQPTRLDPTRTAALARSWFAEMAGVSLEMPELQIELHEMRKLAGRR